MDDKKFHTTNATGLLPTYLVTEAVRTSDGFITPSWRTSVMDRQIALHNALAEEFDDEPSFEGVATQESAPGFGGVTQPADYSAIGLATQKNRLIRALTSAFRHSNVFSWVNFLGGQEETLIEYAYRNRAGTGGPDVFRADLTAGQEIMYGIVGGFDYRGAMPLHFIASTPSYDYGNARAIFDDSIENRTTHLAWVSSDTRVPWQSIVDLLRVERGRIHTACPTNYYGACNSQ